MAEKNRSIKILLIVVNVFIWGFVIIRIWPLLFGGEDVSPSVSPPRHSSGGRSSSSVPVLVPHGGGRDLPANVIQSNEPWQNRDLIPFFAAIFDPFRPILAPLRGNVGPRVVTRKRPVVVINTPQGDRVRKRAVVTHYRLSSIVRISGKTVALLTTGLGAGAQTINVKQGMRLPGGDYVRKIDFAAKNVILVKEGHVFKLVDYAPWVLLIKKP